MGVTLASSFIAPNLIQILKPVNAKEKYKYKKTINKLIEEDVIYLSGEVIRLTEKGKHLLERIEIDDMRINSDKKWDGIWHIVCYDIPESKKKEREYLRCKLSKLNFRFVQKSLWVNPYECKEEIAIIAQNLGIAPFVAYLNTNYLPNQKKLIHYFDL